MPKTYFDEESQTYKGDGLYFIEEIETGHIKIGRGKSARVRLNSLQTGNPRDLRLIDEIDNMGWQEAFWHECWGFQRLRGEWFESSPELHASIQAIRKKQDWTDHVPLLVDVECEVGEWQEHLLDALDAYEEYILIGEGAIMNAVKAAQICVYDPDFDGRCLTTRHADAMAILDAA